MHRINVPIVAERNKMKDVLLRDLAQIRKADRLPDPAYTCFSDYHDGAYDRHPWPCPWTASACNLSAEVAAVGLDWNSAENLRGPFNPEQARTGQIAELATNRNLKDLLSSHFDGLTFEQIFATDIFLFVKPGNMSSNIRSDYLRYCCNKYAVQTLKIVQAKIAICLGKKVYNLLRDHPEAKGRRINKRYVSVGEAIAFDEEVFIGDTLLIPVTHTGAMGINLAGGIAGVAHEWQRARAKLDAAR
jgi:hypothetical protein